MLSPHPGFLWIAVRLQEDATALSHSDIRSRLSDTLSDKLRGSGSYGYINDVYGDDESGDVVYYVDGGLKKAPYSMGTEGGKPMCDIDCDNAKDVVARTTYDEEANDGDDAEHVASMEAQKLYAPKSNIRLIERYISKADRKAMPKEDFAGKGTSYPIKSEQDVEAAVHAIGRAGSGNFSMKAIKANIIAIAKRKGFEGALPKSWRETKASEAAAAAADGTLKLKESVSFPVDIPLREAFKPSYQIKLIAPGKGASAYYPAEVLERDGPKVFKAGTPMRIDHPTRAEEAARPEGSVKDWGAVLESDAKWYATHKDGAGLYGTIKPFSDYAGLIDEKGPYAGVSIRANGSAVMEAGKPVMREGVPVLAALTSAEGVDMVTRAGAGGMFLSEAARTAPTTPTEGQVSEMDEAAVKKLIESAVTAATTPLRERALKGDAMVLATRLLADVSLSEAQKQYIVGQAMRGELPVKDGNLDEEKFAALLVAEAKSYASSFGSGARITGMGALAVVETTTGTGTGARPGETREQVPAGVSVEEAEKREFEADVKLYESVFGMTKVQAEAAARGREL